MLFRKKLLILLSLGIGLIFGIANAHSVTEHKHKAETQVISDVKHTVMDLSGIEYTEANLDSLFANSIESHYLELESGTLLEYTEQFSSEAVNSEQATSFFANQADNLIQAETKPTIVKIYFVQDADGNPERVIVPIYGKGYQLMMHGMLAIAMDGNTILGIKFYEHGETQGFGDKITKDAWQKKFIGKQIYNEDFQLAFRVAKGFAPKKDPFAVDGISGATLTTNGLQNIFNFWFGEYGFGPFLTKMQAGEFN